MQLSAYSQIIQYLNVLNSHQDSHIVKDCVITSRTIVLMMN